MPKQPVTICTVLRSGGRYEPRHVVALQKQILKHYPPAIFACLTDQHIPGVKCVQLKYPSWIGWFAKMELFRPDLKGDILHIDLDSVATGPLDDMVRIGKLTLLRDFYRDEINRPEDGLGSGVMYLPEADRVEIWQAWIDNPFKHISKLRMQGKGDQTFLEQFWLQKAARWQDELPGQVVSYKVHCNPDWKRPSAVGKIPDGTRLICGHGKPFVPWGLMENDPVRKAATLE